MSILFLLKKNLIYGSYTSVIAKSGLLNSARITSHQLKKHLHIHAELEVCVDGNEIDKFLHKHKPKICIIEAIWATPKKLLELTKLHRRVVFIILVHSETAFLAHEGNAVKWLREYNDINRVFPAFNSQGTFEQFSAMGLVSYYLPNIYLDIEKGEDCYNENSGVLNIASFGAIRPFKNQLIQAMAAILFAESRNKVLHFHMNTTRAEQGGEGVFKNIIALFENTRHRLVEHGWKEREAFLHTISKMDLGMQVSFTESFNIIAADFVHQHVPIVVSPTIDWMPEKSKANPENMEDIIEKMDYAYDHRYRSANKNTRNLMIYNRHAIRKWKEFINSF